MRKISEKGRNLFRRFLIFSGVAAISLVFQACYGPPPIRDYIEEDEPKGQETELTEQPAASEESKTEK